MHTIVYNVNRSLTSNFSSNFRLSPSSSNFNFKLQLQFQISNLKLKLTLLALMLNFHFNFGSKDSALKFNLRVQHQAYSFSLVMPIQFHLLTYSHQTLISNKLNIQYQNFNSKKDTDEQSNKQTDRQTNAHKNMSDIVSSRAVNFS